MDGTYSNGEPKGAWKQYHENGKLKLQKTFVDGLAEGEYSEFYDNGQLYYKCNYKKGKISGDVEYFDKDGKRAFIYTFDNDIVKRLNILIKQEKKPAVRKERAKNWTLPLIILMVSNTHRPSITIKEK